MIESNKGQDNPTLGMDNKPNGWTYLIALVILGAVFYGIYSIIL